MANCIVYYNSAILSFLLARYERMRDQRAVDQTPDSGKPIGISEYQLTQVLPSSIAGELPTIEELESELSDDDQHEK